MAGSTEKLANEWVSYKNARFNRELHEQGSKMHLQGATDQEISAWVDGKIDERDAAFSGLGGFLKRKMMGVQGDERHRLPSKIEGEIFQRNQARNKAGVTRQARRTKAELPGHLVKEANQAIKSGASLEEVTKEMKIVAESEGLSSDQYDKILVGIYSPRFKDFLAQGGDINQGLSELAKTAANLGLSQKLVTDIGRPFFQHELHQYRKKVKQEADPKYKPPKKPRTTSSIGFNEPKTADSLAEDISNKYGDWFASDIKRVLGPDEPSAIDKLTRGLSGR